MAPTEVEGEAHAGITSPSISFTTEHFPGLFLASSLGLGFICLLRRPQTTRPLSVAVRAAHGALKGAKALEDLQSPSPRALLLASKALIKGYKASKFLNQIRGAQPDSSFVPKRLATYWRTLNLVRHVRCFLHGDRVVGLGFLSSGHKLSKNFLKVIEDFSGNRFGSAVRNGLDAAGLFIKASVVVAELERIATAVRRGNTCHWGFARNSYSRYVVHSKLKRRTVVCGFEDVRRVPVGHLLPCQRVLIIEQPSVTSLSELLCLSIPLSHHNVPPEFL